MYIVLNGAANNYTSLEIYTKMRSKCGLIFLWGLSSELAQAHEMKERESVGQLMIIEKIQLE